MSETTTEHTDPETEATEPKPDTGELAKVAAEAEKWKALARKHEGVAKANADAAKRLADIEAANATDLEKAVAAARDEGRLEAAKRGNAALVRAEARALAANSRFRDATDAVAFLDLDEISVTDDGDVDVEAITAQLKALADSKPYLLQDDAPPVPTPGQAGIGVAGSTTSADPRAADLAQIQADMRVGKRR